MQYYEEEEQVKGKGKGLEESLTTSREASAFGEPASVLACFKKGWAKASSIDILLVGSLFSNWKQSEAKEGVREERVREVKK